MKPLFMWAGGKTKLLKHYKPYFPSKINTYCEPFFGGGSVFIHIVKSYNPSSIIINDINPGIINIYKSIKSDLETFTNTLNGFEEKYISYDKPGRKSYYYEVRNIHAFEYEKYSSSQEAAMLYFLLKTGFNGIYQLNKNTNGRYGTPCGLLNQKYHIYDREVVNWWHNALQNTTITCGDWKKCVEACPEDCFFFFDPPYRDSFADYGINFGDENLKELIDFAEKQTNVMLSNRDDNGWFDSLKTNLNKTYFDVTYTAGRRKKENGSYHAKKAKEILLYKSQQKYLNDFLTPDNF